MQRGGLWAACVVVLIGLGLLAVGQGAAQDAAGTGKATCSLATLQGTYLYAYDGLQLTDNGQVPFAVAGYDVFEGDGNIPGVASFSVNGEITRNVRAAGTYTVTADCTGTSTYPDLDEHFDLFIAPDGSMFTFISTDPGVVAAGFELRGTAKRVGN